MTSEEWSQRVINAALDMARAAPDSDFAGSPAESVGSLLVLMGRAAGHADQMAGSGPIAAKAREHFRAEMQRAGVTALELLQESARRQQRPVRANEEVTGEIARRRVLAREAHDQPGHPPPAGHAAAGLGAGIAAIGIAIPTIPLDDEHLPELDHVLESVLAHSIAAVARSLAAQGRLRLARP